jgi:AraC-like DNA-binding protein
MLSYVIRTEQVSRILHLLTDLLDVRIVVFDTDHAKLQAFDLKPDSAYCRTLRRDPTADAACERCDRRHLQLAREQRRPVVYECHQGLTEGVVPLFDEAGAYLGALVFGQIRRTVQRPPRRESARLRKLFAGLPRYSPAKAATMAELIAYFGRYMVQNHLVRQTEAPWSEKVKRFVAEHLAEKLTLRRLAEAGGVSQSFLTHSFCKEAGVSALAYVREQRMRRARELLEVGKAVKEVGLGLGFCDEFHFSKAFRKVHGRSPREWAKT